MKWIVALGVSVSVFAAIQGPPWWRERLWQVEQRVRRDQQQEMERLGARLSTMRTGLRDTSTVLATLSNQLHQAVAALDLEQAAHTPLREKLTRLAAESIRIESALRAAQDALRTMTVSRDQWQSRANEQAESKQSLTERVQALEATQTQTLTDLVAARADLALATENAQQAAAQQQSAIQTQETALRETQAERDALREERDALQSRLQSAEAVAAVRTEERDQLQHQLQALKRAAEAGAEEAASLQPDVNP